MTVPLHKLPCYIYLGTVKEFVFESKVCKPCEYLGLPIRTWDEYFYIDYDRALYIICYEPTHLIIWYYEANQCVRKVVVPLEELPEALRPRGWEDTMFAWIKFLDEWRREKKGGNYFMYLINNYPNFPCKRHKKRQTATEIKILFSEIKKIQAKLHDIERLLQKEGTQETAQESGSTMAAQEGATSTTIQESATLATAQESTQESTTPMSTTATYVFVPVVYDGNVVAKIYQGKWVNYDPQQHGEVVAVAYIRGVVHKFSPSGLELYYSGSPCHRLYGLIIRRSQQQQQQPQQSQQPQVINIQTSADYFVVMRTIIDQNIQYVEFAFDKFTFFSGDKLEEKQIDDNSISAIDAYLKATLRGKTLYYVVP